MLRRPDSERDLPTPGGIETYMPVQPAPAAAVVAQSVTHVLAVPEGTGAEELALGS